MFCPVTFIIIFPEVESNPDAKCVKVAQFGRPLPPANASKDIVLTTEPLTYNLKVPVPTESPELTSRNLIPAVIKALKLEDKSFCVIVNVAKSVSVVVLLIDPPVLSA